VRQREAGIYIFKDLHPFITSAPVTRWLRDAIASFKGTEKIIILMSPLQEVPIELEKDVVVLDFPLPDMEKSKSSYHHRGPGKTPESGLRLNQR